jgi:hypothetical protein
VVIAGNVTGMSSPQFALNLAAGWYGFLGGVLSGMVIGLFFHRENWLGGYDSFQRRMVRLGHIAFFGLGLINILFALSASQSSSLTNAASHLLLVGLITMPLTCFATAWRRGFRHLFIIPAGSTGLGVIGLILTLT